MKNAVIYARFSSHSQRDQSIQDQVDACREYAKREGYIIVNVYADYAKTGRNDNREEFQKMLEDSDNKLFDTILVWKLDRFGRNREEMAFNRYRLKKNNVKLISITENIPDSPEGILIEGLMESLAEYYSANLAQNIRRGLESNAKKALVNGGAVPEGYKNVDRHFVIDEERAFIPRTIFEMYVEGYSIKDICDFFNERGITNRKGNPIKHNMVIKILRNRRYAGDYTYKDIVVEDAIPAIVDKETFRKANAMLDSKKYGRTARDKDNFIFAGKVKCGLCGELYVADSGTSKTGKVYKYYKCSRRKHAKKETCEGKSIRKDLLEEEVLKLTLDVLLSENTIDILSKLVIESYNSDDDTLLTLLKGERAELDNKLNNLVKTLEKGLISETITNRIAEIEEEIAKLDYKITAEESAMPDLTEEDVKEFLRGIKKELTVSDPDIAVILNKIVDSIIIYPDKIEVNYRSSMYPSQNIDVSSTNSSLVDQAISYLNFTVRKNTISLKISLE